MGRKKGSLSKKWKAKGGNDLPTYTYTLWLIVGVFLLLAIGLFLGYIMFGQTKVVVSDKPVVVATEPVIHNRNTAPVPPNPPVYPPDLPDEPTRYPPPVNAINTPSRGDPPQYQQVGILTAQSESSDNPFILPLYGRPTYYGSQQWEYYAASDKFHLWRMPVISNSKDCSLQYGCNEIYDGDFVSVPSYEGKSFKVSLYPKNNPRYIPYV
jgi:hypothetical protein